MTAQHVLSLASLLMLASCQGTSTDKGAASQDDAADTKSKKQKNIIEKDIFVGRQFSYITNLGSVNIVYTPGDYRITAKADSSTLQYLDLQFDSNLLTVNLAHDNNTDFNLYGSTTDVTLYVSCPKLECVSTCGNGTFENRGVWQTDTLQLGVMGTGGIQLDTLLCSNLSITSTSTGNISIKHLKGDDASILSRSAATITADVDLKRMSISNAGSQTISISGHANELYIKDPKDKRLDLSKMSSTN